MEFKELEYGRMVEVFALEREIRKMDDEYNGAKREYKAIRKEKLESLEKLKTEINAGVLQMGLFEEGKLQSDKGTEAQSEYPEREEKLMVAGRDGEGVFRIRAKEMAKDFLRIYVLRGDTLEHLSKSMMGVGTKEYNADIRKGIVIISDLTGTLVHTEKFSLKEIYNAILEEKKWLVPEKKRRGDTMKVKRTLKRVVLSKTCSINNTGNDFNMGCCQCEKDMCSERLAVFGNAAGCTQFVACSNECPRRMK